MSCYLPMIEKLKSAATGKNRSNIVEVEKNKKARKTSKTFSPSFENEDSSYRFNNNNSNARFRNHHNEGYDSEPPPYDSIHVDEPYMEPVNQSRPGGPLPRRDQAGFTITHDIGEFPNRVPLHIRYDHPRLALSDVAFQRQHQLHHHDVQRQQQMQQNQHHEVQRQQLQQHQHDVQRHQHQHQSTPLPLQQQQQHHHSVLGSPMNSRGVLSLGLPPQLMPNSIFRRNVKSQNSPNQARPPPSASSDVIHHTYETLNSRRFINYATTTQPQSQENNRCRPTLRRSSQELYNNNNSSNNNNNVTMLPPAQVRTRSQHPRGSSLPRKAKKIPSSSYSQILLMRPKSVQDDLILNYPNEGHPEPYGVTSLKPYRVTSLERRDDLDSSLKTTDSGQTSGCSSGSSTVGSQSPKSNVDSLLNVDNISVDTKSTLPPIHPAPHRQSAFTSLPNRGPPPRHLIPATLRPSPAVKMHPADILLSLREQQQHEHEKEIADNAACSVEESSSATEESDSIGSIRNSSPEAGSNPQSLIRRNNGDNLHRISSPEFLSTPKFNKTTSSSPVVEITNKLGRLSPMVTGNASAKLQRQILSSRYSAATNTSDWGYHSMGVRGPAGVRVTPSSASSLESVPRGSPDFWDVRATKTPVRDLRLSSTTTLSSSKRSPVVSSTSSPKVLKGKGKRGNGAGVAVFDKLPDSVVLKVLSYLNTNDLVKCSRVSRRFYFLAWDPDLWTDITLTGERTDADLALKTVMRLLSRNSVKHSPQSLTLNGCQRLTDRGLAIIARTCPQLLRLEVQNCINVTNGGLMDLVSKCQLIDHLDVSGCHMISTISVHQPPPSPAHRMMMGRGGPAHQPLRRLLNLQYLDLTDCSSLEDSGLKMVVENCPQLIYLFLRRCSAITDIGVKYVASYCLHLRELSVSDCVQISDFGIYEVAKLGPNLRYLSVAKCNQITDAGVKQIARLCYKLRYLNVRGCESVSDDAIEMLARSCSRLRSLDIGKCDVTDLGLKMLSEHCPNLKKLSVKSCDMVSDVGIQNVAYYCRGLQQLNIQDCPVTVEGYRTVKKFCKRCIIEHSHPGFF